MMMLNGAHEQKRNKERIQRQQENRTNEGIE